MWTRSGGVGDPSHSACERCRARADASVCLRHHVTPDLHPRCGVHRIRGHRRIGPPVRGGAGPDSDCLRCSDPSLPPLRHRPSHRSNDRVRDGDRGPAGGLCRRGHFVDSAGTGVWVDRRPASWTVALATLAAAAIFRPVLGWARRVVARRFNREQYDAELVVESFAVRLRDEVGTQQVREDLLQVLGRTMQPRVSGVWLSDRHVS